MAEERFAVPEGGFAECAFGAFVLAGTMAGKIGRDHGETGVKKCLADWGVLKRAAALGGLLPAKIEPVAVGMGIEDCGCGVRGAQNGAGDLAMRGHNNWAVSVGGDIETCAWGASEMRPKLVCLHDAPLQVPCLGQTIAINAQIAREEHRASNLAMVRSSR